MKCRDKSCKIAGVVTAKGKQDAGVETPASILVDGRLHSILHERIRVHSIARNIPMSFPEPNRVQQGLPRFRNLISNVQKSFTQISFMPYAM